ncbi:unnamed protein product [Durusdinium trenchii]|uniref:D-alanyl-D-alanine carboxypeptidase (DD-carboxypeptidase) (DD-CPase) n=3 Tax=Durusdinium trenchii TaxID=1381693 RepID=A0ABP0K0R3_9DINO
MGLLEATFLGMAAVSAAAFDGWNDFNGVARVTNAAHEVLFQKEYGFLNIPYKDPMPADAIFPVASNTKLYVAVALYQLQEAGKVDLNASIADYLNAKDLKNFGMHGTRKYCPKVAGSSECQVVRFVDLLAMSSGIPNPPFRDYFLPYAGSIGLTVKLFINQDLLFIPGTEYDYSNSAFILAGYFVEKLSGKSLREYLQKHIISVLEQSSTEYDPYDYQLSMAGDRRKRVYEYYQYRDPKTHEIYATGECRDEFDLGTANGAGGVLSTVADEQLFYYTLFNFSKDAMGKPLLQDPRSLIDLVRPRMPTSPEQKGGYFWYAQGLLSLCNWSVDHEGCDVIPNIIGYEGGLMCVHTANLLDLHVHPAVMTSVYSSTVVFDVKKALVKKMQASKTGDFLEASDRWPQQMEVSKMAWKLHNEVLNQSKQREKMEWKVRGIILP